MSSLETTKSFSIGIEIAVLARVNDKEDGEFITTISWYLDGTLQKADELLCLLNTGTTIVGIGEHKLEATARDSEGVRSNKAKLFFEIVPTVRQSSSQCANDPFWFLLDRSGRRKRCSWVRKNTSRRCNAIGANGKPAYAACPKVCGNDKQWKVQVGQGANTRQVGCGWVRKKPEKRCGRRGKAADSRPAFRACALSCCEFNASRRQGPRGRCGGGIPLNTHVSEDENGSSNDYEGSADCRRPPRPQLGYPAR